MARRVERGVSRPGEPKRMPAAGRVCGQVAGPEWCERDVLARGLCRPHYRRAAKGLPLDPDDGRLVGVTPSGHGVWGVLEEREDRLRCHECGGWYVALGVHAGMVHDGAHAYRLAHGLLMSTSLNAPPLRERLSRAASATADRLPPPPPPSDLTRERAERGLRLRRRA